jgi:hypothetical protein
MRIAGFCLLASAALPCASACLLDTTNDTDDAETGNGTGNVTSGSGSGSESSGTGGAQSSGTATATEASTAADDTAGAGVCGWGPTGDEAVPEGYVCGGDGEDPRGMFPMLCPEAIDLQVGADCSSIEGTGCCDAQGNAWFCGDDGSGPALARIEC